MNQEPPNSMPKPWPAELESLAISDSQRQSRDDRPQAEAISVSSVWQMASLEAADDALAGRTRSHVYRRDGHPNERTLTDKLAQLHRVPRALVTAQGMSAIGALALTVLKPGAVAWIGDELYGKSSHLFDNDLARWQVATQVFDPTDRSQIESLAKSQVDLVLVETISNPRVRVTDLGQLAKASHAAGALLCVDNTFATHLICRPVEFGADVVIESLSKQVNGHSDSMLGLIAGSDLTLMSKLNDTLSTFGFASSPLDCYLTHRGLMSLAVRMERACSNALALAQALEEVLGESNVDYPGLPTHPQHRLAIQQLSGGYGWMLSFRMEGGAQDVQKLFEALRPEVPFMPSLGDVNTTVSHPTSTSHRGLNPAQCAKVGISAGTVRVSCGIESTEWMVDRFIRALKATLAAKSKK